MTDFIHENPSEQKKSAPPEAPTTEKERQKRVYTYIAVLFTAAFILILWSFLSTHRSNQEVIDRLEGSTSMMQSTLEQNAELEERVEALEAQTEELEDALERTEKALDAAEEALRTQETIICALDRLRKLEVAYESYRYDTAKDLLRSFEEDDLAQYLPTASLHTDPDGNDAEAPLDTYRRISAKLFPDGIE